MRESTGNSVFFREYNANPWKMNINDCGVRSTSLAINIPYEEVCEMLGVPLKTGHGLLSDAKIYLRKIKRVFDRYFDIVVDFNETLPKDAIPETEYDTASLFDEEEPRQNSEISLVQWMKLYRGTGLYLVACHSPSRTRIGHLVCVSTNTMKIFDTFDCSNYRVYAWMRVKERRPYAN